MARMHARRRGSSSSTKPFRKEVPGWVQLNPSEIEELVVKLYQQGHSTSVIGMKLRDLYGVPDVELATGKKITKILKQKNIEFKLPEDLENLLKKAVRLDNHLKENRKDLHNKRRLQLTEAKIRRLVKYYKRKGVLPKDWKYTLQTAKLAIE